MDGRVKLTEQSFIYIARLKARTGLDNAQIIEYALEAALGIANVREEIQDALNVQRMEKFIETGCFD